MFFYISRGQGKRGATWRGRVGCWAGRCSCTRAPPRPPVEARASSRHVTATLTTLIHRQNRSSSRHCSKYKLYLISNCDTQPIHLKKKCKKNFFVKSCQYFCEVFELAGVGLMCASERCDMESPGEETGRVVPPAPHTPAAPQPNNGSNKIIGRNVNGTSKSRSAINFLMFYNFLLNFKRRRHLLLYL